MLKTPFLTDLDSRATVKGSRDPLGIQQIWTRLGRHVVGNLTTVSNSVRDFTTLLLGYYFAEQLVDDLGPGTELATFLKWEQLAAYSRAEANNDFAFRGTEKVQKTLSEGSRICLSDERSHQILSNQKIYGLWGLYTMPARASGLIEGDPSRLTPLARTFVERVCLPILEETVSHGKRRVLESLREKQFRIDVKKSNLIIAVGKVLKPLLLKREREFFRTHLLEGGPEDKTQGRQRQLAEILTDTLTQPEFAWSPAAVGQLVKVTTLKGGEWHSLAHQLHRIRTSETVLAPSAALFTHILGQHDKSIKSIIARLVSEWGSGLRTISPSDFRELRAELSEDDPETSNRWIGIAEGMSSGDYGTLLGLLIEQNKSVMLVRGGAAWVEERQGRLHVRFRDEQGALPSQKELASLWRFPYFLDSLRLVANALKEH